jgi:hypothetical protein
MKPLFLLGLSLISSTMLFHAYVPTNMNCTDPQKSAIQDYITRSRKQCDVVDVCYLSLRSGAFMVECDGRYSYWLQEKDGTWVVSNSPTE